MVSYQSQRALEQKRTREHCGVRKKKKKVKKKMMMKKKEKKKKMRKIKMWKKMKKRMKMRRRGGVARIVGHVHRTMYCCWVDG